MTTKEASAKVFLSQHRIAEKARQKEIVAYKVSETKWLVKLRFSNSRYELVKPGQPAELSQSPKSPLVEKPDSLPIIPLEVNFLAELLVKGVLDPSYEVLVPVPRETARICIEIEEFFEKLGPVEEIAKAVRESIEKERSQLDSAG